MKYKFLRTRIYGSLSLKLLTINYQETQSQEYWSDKYVQKE